MCQRLVLALGNGRQQRTPLSGHCEGGVARRLGQVANSVLGRAIWLQLICGEMPPVAQTMRLARKREAPSVAGPNHEHALAELWDTVVRRVEQLPAHAIVGSGLVIDAGRYEVAIGVLGGVAGLASSITGYWFGSRRPKDSRGS